jgi:uncharacterized membrane protein
VAAVALVGDEAEDFIRGPAALKGAIAILFVIIAFVSGFTGVGCLVIGVIRFVKWAWGG